MRGGATWASRTRTSSSRSAPARARWPGTCWMPAPNVRRRSGTCSSSAANDLALHTERVAPEAPVGSRVPLQRPAAAWVRSALGVLDRGRIVIVDYVSTTSAMAGRPWTEWVRTYRAHGPGGRPLDDLGD